MSSGATTTRFLYDGDKLVMEYNGAGAATRAYVHGPGVDEPLVLYDAGQRRFLHADHQGSVIALNDDNGAPVAINGYDAWGIPNAGNAGRFGYTGQAWIPELGLWYYKARFYSPTTGRFMQTDPVGYEDQINLYAYVGNDPMNRADPTGKCASIKDQGTRAECLKQREAQVEAARGYLKTQSVQSGRDEPGYIATYNEISGAVTVRKGDEAGVRTESEVAFVNGKGNQLEAHPDGRIFERQGGRKADTNEIILVTGHGHPKENSGGGAAAKSLDRANERLNGYDSDLSRAAPAVIKTPSGKIKVYSNGRLIE